MAYNTPVPKLTFKFQSASASQVLMPAPQLSAHTLYAYGVTKPVTQIRKKGCRASTTLRWYLASPRLPREADDPAGASPENEEAELEQFRERNEPPYRYPLHSLCRTLDEGTEREQRYGLSDVALSLILQTPALSHLLALLFQAHHVPSIFSFELKPKWDNTYGLNVEGDYTSNLGKEGRPSRINIPDQEALIEQNYSEV